MKTTYLLNMLQHFISTIYLLTFSTVKLRSYPEYCKVKQSDLSLVLHCCLIIVNSLEISLSSSCIRVDVILAAVQSTSSSDVRDVILAVSENNMKYYIYLFQLTRHFQ